MKARSLLGYGISLAVLGIGSLPVFAQNSQEYPAASLPDGDYFYGQSRSATTYGTYFIFRKTGNIITGQQYNAPAAGDCFQGKIEQNTIVDITLGYLNDAFTIESGYHFVSNQEPINLNLYYRLRFDQASEGAVRGLQRCINAFPNSQIVPQLPTWNQFIASNDAPDHYFYSDFDLPQEFRNGYVYKVQGANSSGVYIFKAGLSNYPPPVSSGLNQIDFESGDSYVKAGKAIFLFLNLGNSGLRYVNDTEVRFPEPGRGCFKTTCLTAPFLSKDKIRQILLSQRPININ